jgi:hypothetical protein
MFDDAGRTPRREFLGQMGLIAAAAAMPSAASRAESSRRAASASPWDMSWVEKVTTAPYKVVLDIMTLSDDYLYAAADIMDRYHEVYGTPDDQTRVVLVMRRLGLPMALQDSLWDRYGIGQDRKIDDPATKAPARRNPFLHAAANEKESFVVESRVESLIARGAIVLVCNRAAMHFASSVAEKLKQPLPDIQNEVRNGLVPSARLMPDGVFAFVRAQNAGCATYRDS